MLESLLHTNESSTTHSALKQQQSVISPWYVLSMPKGREATLCKDLQNLIPKDTLKYAFVPHKERWIKRQGRWFLEPVNMYPGYAFAISSDIQKLTQALLQLSLPIKLVDTTPIDSTLVNWFVSVMDSCGLIKSSTAEIVDGSLYIHTGPLIGQERSITKIDRHKRMCVVSLENFSEHLALNVTSKT